MDGVAINLRYENGVSSPARRAATAPTGDDITANLKTIRSIPLSLNRSYRINTDQKK